ncbi:hypothetical protein [Actinomadura sp. GTD37]|uniref:SecDF P1 head subdomain-containing protein n=1 Tax=Actinomadura sp. GTD37 TaxID=1778030 RepID=UPI0035C194FD
MRPADAVPSGADTAPGTDAPDTNAAALGGESASGTDTEPIGGPPPGTGSGGGTRPLRPAGGGDPAEALGQESLRGGAGPQAATAVLPVPDGEAARRRARAAERHRQAAEVKRSRAGRRRPRPRRTPANPVKAADQHRAALLVMVLTLGLLIAAVAVTGGLIASSMKTRPVALTAPLHIYPVAQATAGPCPAGTQGITGQAGNGPTCYHLTQGIAIHKVADLRVQKSRVRPGGYDVAVTLRPVDRQAFAQLTRATVGRDLAFVVRDRLVTLPRVDMAITDGKVVVTGSPDRATAKRLVRELKGR